MAGVLHKGVAGVCIPCTNFGRISSSHRGRECAFAVHVVQSCLPHHNLRFNKVLGRHWINEGQSWHSVSGHWNKAWKSRRISPMAVVVRDPVGPGQESVWDYPRPPALEAVKERIRIIFNDETIADTTNAYRVLETSHPPVYYLPSADVKMEHLARAPGSTFCEWKGTATWWTLSVGGKTAENVAWSYEDPTELFLPIKGYLAFYAGPMDACYVGEEQAQPQPGKFYGGWVTSKIVGPFKGGAGSWGW